MSPYGLRVAALLAGNRNLVQGATSAIDAKRHIDVLGIAEDNGHTRYPRFSPSVRKRWTLLKPVGEGLAPPVSPIYKNHRTNLPQTNR